MNEESIKSDMLLKAHAEAESLTGKTGQKWVSFIFSVVLGIMASAISAIYALLETDKYKNHLTAGKIKSQIGELEVPGYGQIGEDNIRVVNKFLGPGTGAVVLLNQRHCDNFPDTDDMSDVELATNKAILAEIRRFLNDLYIGYSSSIYVINKVTEQLDIEYELSLSSSTNATAIEDEITSLCADYCASVSNGVIVPAKLQAIPNEISGVISWKLIEPSLETDFEALSGAADISPNVTFNYN